MTLLEVVVILFVLAFLVLMLLPALGAAKMKGRLNCHNQLKQVGVAFNVWAGENRGKYPTEISLTNGGALEAASTGNAAAIFQVMSRQLPNSKILVCPADFSRQSVTNSSFLRGPKNVSYFVGLDADPNSRKTLLSGDDNFESAGWRIKSGVRPLSANAMYYWSVARHNRAGNILLADGSVQLVNNSVFARWVAQTGLATNRLLIP